MKMDSYGVKVNEKFKQDSIAELEKNLKTKGENILPSDWENHLTLDYWKNWREKIKSFQYVDEVVLYGKFFEEIKTWIANECVYSYQHSYNIVKKIEEELANVTIDIDKMDYGDDGWKIFPKDPLELILVRHKRNDLYSTLDYKWLPNWENHLTLDYWKNWREKIMAFKNIKELYLYTTRLRALQNFIVNKVKNQSYANWNQKRDITNITIFEEEQRLVKVESEEKWKKDVANAFPNTKLRELSIEEILNDSWFRKQLGFDEQTQNKNTQGSLDSNQSSRDHEGLIISEIIIFSILLVIVIVIFKRVLRKKDSFERSVTP